MLHTVNKSPFQTSLLDTCLKFVAEKQPIVLYEDGVIAVMAGSKFEPTIKEILKKNPVYALQADLKARAIKNVVDGVKTIDYAGFVDLVVEHKVNNWL